MSEVKVLGRTGRSDTGKPPSAFSLKDKSRNDE